jgi:hypothetical protein
MFIYIVRSGKLVKAFQGSHPHPIIGVTRRAESTDITTLAIRLRDEITELRRRTLNPSNIQSVSVIFTPPFDIEWLASSVHPEPCLPLNEAERAVFIEVFCEKHSE